MKTNVRTASPDDTILRQAAEKMALANVGFFCRPRCDGAGDRDDHGPRHRGARCGGLAPRRSRRAGDVISRQVLACRPDDPPTVAEDLMAQNQVSRPVVLDDEDRLAGRDQLVRPGRARTGSTGGAYLAGAPRRVRRRASLPESPGPVTLDGVSACPPLRARLRPRPALSLAFFSRPRACLAGPARRASSARASSSALVSPTADGRRASRASSPRKLPARRARRGACSPGGAGALGARGGRLLCRRRAASVFGVRRMGHPRRREQGAGFWPPHAFVPACSGRRFQPPAAPRNPLSSTSPSSRPAAKASSAARDPRRPRAGFPPRDRAAVGSLAWPSAASKRSASVRGAPPARPGDLGRPPAKAPPSPRPCMIAQPIRQLQELCPRCAPSRAPAVPRPDRDRRPGSSFSTAWAPPRRGRAQTARPAERDIHPTQRAAAPHSARSNVEPAWTSPSPAPSSAIAPVSARL